MSESPRVSSEQLAHVATHVQILRESLGGPYKHLPPKSTITVLMKHGGFQILTKSGAVLQRLRRQLPNQPEGDLAQVAVTIKERAELFFGRLCRNSYGIPSELMSFLTFPHEGTTYTDPNEKEAENPNLPAVFTFVGQFIDHDLTFNGANLFDPEFKDDAVDFASPLLDLDSVYGGRNYPKDPADPGLKDIIDNRLVYNADMSFKLVRLAVNAYDLVRWTDTSQSIRLGSAYIFDPRNDENQIILQIHILLMRAHNRLLKKYYADHQGLDPKKESDAAKAWTAVKEEVILTWQSVLLNDYLPRICIQSTLAEVLQEIQKKDFGNLKYKPDADGTLKMPHEFAIAFRFGHSMLRSAYKLNSAGAIQLFNNRDIDRKGDLRGGRALRRDHVIDWNIFYPENEFDASLSLKIDSKVTHVVFDLPESAVPDAIKTSGNLPYRNLTRSREIDLACGEDLAEFFGIPEGQRLTRFQVEPNDQAHYLFEADVDFYAPGSRESTHGLSASGVKDTRFKTPLWYYILKEAEVMENGERLGPLGSRLVAEVIVGGIFYGKETKFNPKWISSITHNNIVKLRDLISFVDEDPPIQITSVESVV